MIIIFIFRSLRIAVSGLAACVAWRIAASSLGEALRLFTVLTQIWRQRTAKKGLSQGRDEV